MQNRELYLKVIEKFKAFIETDKEFKVIEQEGKYIVIFYDGIGYYAKYMEDPEQLFETLLQEWADSFEEQMDIELCDMNEINKKEFNEIRNSYLSFFKEIFGKEFAERMRRQRIAYSY